jgi:hypothetical protein
MVLEHYSVYDELAYFLASLSPKKVLAFKISAKAQERVSFLIAKNKETGLSTAENAEMERFMVLDHIVQLAKAKALQKLNMVA